jgi:RimJ/RimL family protein N-acetyltransferase
VLDVDQSLPLVLRPIVPSDTDAWVTHVRQDAEHLGEFLGWPARTADPAVARQFITRYGEREAGRRLLLGVFNGTSLRGGAVLMSHDVAAGSVELGCWIASALEGRGVMRRVCIETLRYGRHDLLVHRVEWRTASGNARSRALATRLGFTHEGRLREASLHHDRRQHLDLFSLIGPEIDQLLDGAA